MSLFDNFIKRFAEEDNFFQDLVYEDADPDAKNESFNEEDPEIQELLNKEENSKFKSLRIDINKTIKACIELVNYSKFEKVPEKIKENFNTIVELLLNIRNKLYNSGLLFVNHEEVFKKIDNLCKYINTSNLNLIVDFDNNIETVCNLSNVADLIDNYRSIFQYLKNYPEAYEILTHDDTHDDAYGNKNKVVLDEDKSIDDHVISFENYYKEFISLIRSLLLDKHINLNDDKKFDSIIKYYQTIFDDYFKKVVKKDNKISESDFLNFKSKYIQDNPIKDYLKNLITFSSKENISEINMEFINVVEQELAELKFLISNLFKSKRSLNKKDKSNDAVLQNLYGDILQEVSSPEFIKQYNISRNSSGENPSTRWFLQTLFYKLFNLKNMDKYCTSSVEYIEKKFREYIPKLRLRDLPEDYKENLQSIVNFGVLKLSISGTASFITQNNIGAIIKNLDYYTKHSTTRLDVRSKIVTPLKKLYEGILKLINPAVLCKNSIVNLPDKEIVSSDTNEVVFVVNAEDVVNFLDEVKNFIEDQIKILEAISAEVEVDEDNIISDSLEVNVSTNLLLLYNSFYKLQTFQNIFNDYNKYLAHL